MSYSTKQKDLILSVIKSKKKEFTIKLQEIYNEKKYNFLFKDNTIKNILGRQKANSLRFTKYSAIENRFNKNEELILWEYNNSSFLQAL